jgi:Fe-S cluster assembly protein SufD
MSDWPQTLSSALPLDSEGPGWPAALREHGAQQFTRHGLPDTRVEQWKYTSLRALEERQPGLGDPAASPASPAPAPLVETRLRAQLHHGDFHALHGDLPPGVQIRSMREALSDEAPALKALLESLDLEQRWQALAALNTATLNPGLVVQVDADVDAGTLLLQWTGCDDAERLFNSRVCVLLAEGATLGLAEQFEDGPDRASMLNGVMQVSLGAGAQLNHARLQQLAPASMLLTRTEVQQSANSQFQTTILDLGAGLARHDVRAALQGPGATCALNGACVTAGQGHSDHHFEAAHLAGGCHSSQMYRAVANQRSRAVFNGKVHIAAGADGSESLQSSAGLLLSKLAEIDAKPELEIYADEVIASHGATVGQLDEQTLFYLRSRGLGAAEARRLLTMAFCRSVTDRVAVSEWREPLGACLERRLEATGVTDV